NGNFTYRGFSRGKLHPLTKCACHAAFVHAVGDAWTALEITPIGWNVSGNGTCSCPSIRLNIGLAATLNQAGCFRQVWKCIWDTMACHALEEHQQAVPGPNQVLQVEEETILLIWGGLKKMKPLLGRMPVTMIIGKTIHLRWRVWTASASQNSW